MVSMVLVDTTAASNSFPAELAGKPAEALVITDLPGRSGQSNRSGLFTLFGA